jgi:hypothetical protein
MPAVMGHWRLVVPFTIAGMLNYTAALQADDDLYITQPLQVGRCSRKGTGYASLQALVHVVQPAVLQCAVPHAPCQCSCHLPQPRSQPVQSPAALASKHHAQHLFAQACHLMHADYL